MPMCSSILLFSITLMEGSEEGEIIDTFCQLITLISNAPQLQPEGDIYHAVGISRHVCCRDGMSPIRTWSLGMALCFALLGKGREGSAGSSVQTSRIPLGRRFGFLWEAGTITRSIGRWVEWGCQLPAVGSKDGGFGIFHSKITPSS